MSSYFQEDLDGLEKQVASLKSSVQEKTMKLASAQETIKKLEEQLEEVCATVKHEIVPTYGI